MFPSSSSSSLLNIPNSQITNPNLAFFKITTLSPIKKHHHHQSVQSHFIFSLDSPSPSSSCSCNSSTVANSLTLDQDSSIDDDEEFKKAEAKFGSKVRVKVPLKVYHVPKVPEVELEGRIGVLKQYAGFHKGKKISANLPFKVEFVNEAVTGKDGKPGKFVAHLREDEFEFLDD